MRLSPITTPAVEPVSPDEAKNALRLTGADEDGFVGSLIAAAVRTVEAATDRALILRKLRLSLDAWPASGIVRPPIGPSLSLEAVRIRDRTGGAVTVPPEELGAEIASDPPEMRFSGLRPAPEARLGGVEIDFTAGYGTDGAAVPAPLRLAVLRLVARWYERRGDEDPGSRPIDGEIAALLAPYRRARLA